MSTNFNSDIYNNASLDEIISDRFAQYAKYIIQDRALPNLHDGLKPVQRRIIYALEQLKIYHNQSYKKAARIVGEVIGKYHPHGDSSVYEALVRMSQTWKLRYPLIDFQGNNGSIDGDKAAAMRYTEVRLTKISSFLYNHLFENTSSFINNFDGSETEPIELPAELPFILLNGSTGIAAGYATNIPPHNLQEIINGLIALTRNPNLSLSKLTKIIPGPDFPTGGIIVNPAEVKNIYSTGKGSLILQSKIKHENNDLIVTEIPYDVNKNNLLQQLDKIKNEKSGLLIKDVVDESDRRGLQIRIKLQKQAKSQVVKAYLLKHSSLQLNFNCNMISIINGHPIQAGLQMMLQSYIKFNTKITKKYLQWHLNKYVNRLEILNGLIKAQDILDDIIKIIRSSTNKQAAINNLQAKFMFSILQAEAIVNLRLYRLTSTNLNTLKLEANELQAKIIKNESILGDSNKLSDYQIQQWETIKKEFGDDRRTKLGSQIQKTVIKETDLIAQVNVIAFISKNGYIKLQKTSNIPWEEEVHNFKENDYLISQINTTNFAKLSIITNQGQLIFLPLFKIPIMKKKDMGVHINSIIKTQDLEKILFATDKDLSALGDQILLTTKLGLTKQILIKNLLLNKTQKITKLKKGDSLSSIDIHPNPNAVIFINNHGYASKYSIQDIPTLSTTALGVKAMNLKTDQIVLHGFYLHQDDSLLLVDNRIKYKLIKTDLIKIYNRPVTGTRLYPKGKSLFLLTKIFIINKSHELYFWNIDHKWKIMNIDRMHNLEWISQKKLFPKSNITQFMIIRKPISILKSQQSNPKKLYSNLDNKKTDPEPTNLVLNFDDLLVD